MFLVDHWAGLSWFSSNIFEKFSKISLRSHFLITSGGILSGPGALLREILSLAFWYSSIVNSPVLKYRSWNTVCIVSFSSIMIGSFPSSCWKWSNQFWILSRLSLPSRIPLWLCFLPDIVFISLQQLECFCVFADSSMADMSLLNFSSRTVS